MELLFYSGIVSIIDWKYTKSVGIKNQVFWAGPCSYKRLLLEFLGWFQGHNEYFPKYIG